MVFIAIYLYYYNQYKEDITLWFNINPASSVPIYVQLVDEIKTAVARGVLAPGERMPTVRELASGLSINPLTISKAYQRLEQEGVLVTMRSRGTFVAEGPSVLNKEAEMGKIREMLLKVLVEAYHLGITPDEIKALMDKTIEEWNRERSQNEGE